MNKKIKRKGIFVLKTSLFVISIATIFLIGKRVFANGYLSSKDTTQPLININNPVPNVVVNHPVKSEEKTFKNGEENTELMRQAVNKMGPWTSAPKHEIYSPNETKKFKEQELILPADIENWYNQAKKFKLFPNNNYNAILHGKSGTGKTSLARRLARESDLAFVAVKGSHLRGQMFEQRITLDKFKALFDSLRENKKIKDSNKTFILFLDEANQLGDKLECLKDLLAQVNDQNNDLTIIWVIALNNRGEIDEAVWENEERFRYELNFNWNKNIFLEYASQTRSLSELLDIDVPLSYDSESKKINNSQKLRNLLSKEGTKCDSIYNRFNFKNLRLLAKYQAEFIYYFKILIDLTQLNEHVIPSFNYHEWKGAISEHYPQVTKMELVNENAEQQISLTNEKIVPRDTLLSLVFEYVLYLFWNAKEQNKLNNLWDMVNPTSFLTWAREKYGLEELGLMIYREQDKQDKNYYYIAHFTPKIFPKVA